MKQTILEKTNNYVTKLNHELGEQRSHQKELIRRQMALHSEQIHRLTQGEKGIRYSCIGMKAGYVTLVGGAITTLFSPWKGLGILALGGISILSNVFHIKRLKEKLNKENKS